MLPLETPRLRLRHLILADAPYILELVNEPGWLANIGDKQVHDLDGARGYMEKGPLALYREHGFGLYLVELKDSATPVGLCGLIKRDGLADVDIGYALSSAYWGRGYALEAAQATLDHARELGLERLVAITSRHNDASARLLSRLGMTDEGLIRLPQDEEQLRYFAITL
ncbi:GNAT family N-acetyltransferase [Gallaecimonas sp. GXIMD4217]|uniref:GNAT family N-acetyltransferase n=1 Tax=Gallaecimonas sp. GXIMD4217 TaxID=3131927 RepID=UPI00311B276E